MDHLNKFATIVKPISYKFFFARRVKRGLKIRYINIVTSFFYCFFVKEIYVIQPKLFHKKYKKRKVFLLLKVIYGLKKSSFA